MVSKRCTTKNKALFCHRLKQTPSGNIKEGISQRYTVMTLLGLLRAEAAGYRSPVDISATIDALYRNTEWVDNIGDLGLLLWLSSVSSRKLDSFYATFDLENALRNYSDARKRLTMELAWFLTGLTYASRAEQEQPPYLEPLARQTYTLLQSNQGKDGLFGHMAQVEVVGRSGARPCGQFCRSGVPNYCDGAFWSNFRDERGVAEFAPMRERDLQTAGSIRPMVVAL